MRPLVSIIMPFYNLEDWMLERCLHSIYQQEVAVGDFEVIIVDDGSKVFPSQIVDSYNNKGNLRYLRQENQGPAIARNTGMAKAEGEYIYFVDPDDYLYPGTLSKCIEKLKEQPVDLINFQYKMCWGKDLDNVKQPPVSWSKQTCTGGEYGTKHNIPACVWLYIFKKSICTDNNITFPTDFFYSDDEEFTPKIYFFARSVLTCNIIMYAYYQREDSIVSLVTPTNAKKRINDFQKVITHLLEFRQLHASTALPDQLQGLERRIHFLSVDYIIKVFRNNLAIDEEILFLKNNCLYPLTRKCYSYKYIIFRLLVNNKVGLSILRYSMK